MPPPTRFDAHVSKARVIATRLAAHDPEYERALRSGTIADALQASVQFALGALEIAYVELGDELALRCGLSKGAIGYRLPVYPAPPNGQPVGSSGLLDSIRSMEAELATKVRSHLEVATVDGWLGTLMLITASPSQMNLRRATATVSTSKGLDGIIEMNLRSASGELIPMFAPILLQEGSPSIDSIGKGYYLAVLPEALEIVSFLDRCVRGMSSLGDRLRAELINFGY